jgi:hypothetical protein
VSGLVPVDTGCPYCGKPLELLVDPSVDAQSYVEDCEVCCRPIEVRVRIDPDGTPSVAVHREDD